MPNLLGEMFLSFHPQVTRKAEWAWQ